MRARRAGRVPGRWVAALAAAGGGEAGEAGESSRSRGSTRARTTTAAGRRRTTRAGCTSRRSWARKVQTTYKENVFSNRRSRRSSPASSATATRSSSATSFGISSSASTASCREVPGRLLRAGDRARSQEEPGRVLRRRRGHDLPVRDGRRRRDEEGHDRLRRRRSAIPEVVRHANAFTLGAQATHPGAKVKLVWTNSWFSPPKETAGRAEPRRGRRRRARPERRQPGDRRHTPSRSTASRGSATTPTRRSSRRSQWLTAAVYNWGAVLPAARQGGDERHLEARLLLRHDQGRLHDARAVRPGGVGEDEGADRGEAEGDHGRQVQRVRGPALRPERQAAGSRRASVSTVPGPVLDAVARQGRHRSVSHVRHRASRRGDARRTR